MTPLADAIVTIGELHNETQFNAKLKKGKIMYQTFDEYFDKVFEHISSQSVLYRP